MNKLLKKIVGAAVGLTMAIGVGFAVANSSKEINKTSAATADAYYQFTSKSWVSKLNDDNYSSSGTTKNWTGTEDGNQLTNNQGVQITSGISSATATCPDSYNGISQIVIRYCTNASKGEGSLVAKVGSTAGSPASFSVTKPSSGGTTLKDATFTFSTPLNGQPVITANCTTSSVYVFGVHVTYTADSSAELTGLRIASGTPNKLYEPGQSFDGTGLTVYASWDSEEDTSKNVLSDVVWNGGNALTAGTNQTIIGYHSDDENEEYPIQVTGVDVVNPDFTHTYSSNSMFEGTAYSTTETKTYTPTNGPEYITLGGYNYSSGTSMSFRNTSGMYVGNNTAYAKYIRRIVIVVNSNSQYNAVKMYEGPSALSEATEVEQKASADKLTLTYNFSDSNRYFKFKSTSATYINMTSFKVFLGSTPVTPVVTDLNIATPGSVYVGKTLQLNATVSYSNHADDSSVTWAVTSGSGATVNASTGLVTATAATATTITATSVFKNSSDQALTKSVTITPLANPIVSVAWDTSAAKKTYNVGESLSIVGVVATGTNAAGDDDVEITLTESNFSGFDSSAPTNSQTITVSYPNEVTPASPFTTTYTISVVAVPDIYLVNTDFENNYTATSLTSEDGTTWTLSNIGNYSSSIQIKDGSSYGMYNTSELGRRISKVAVNLKKGSINLAFSANVLNFNGASSEAQSYSTLDEDFTYAVTGDYQFMRITPSGSTQLNYIKIWYDPFVPTVELDETSFVFTQGETGYCDVEASASHFTNDSGVVFTATSSNQSVLGDNDILVVDNAITIDKESVNPGTTTVTVTGTYSTASEEATASFTITCNAASRNLLSIAITTASSDVEFEAGAKFTTTNLVVTGTFDAAPLTANVTSECTFKLWNGETETAVVPGTSVLSAGSYTVRVSHSESAASETLTYSINVISPSTLSVTQSVIGDSFIYTDTNESSIDVSLNGQLDSTVDLESYGLYKSTTNIQMNSGKGTYIKNTIAVPGRILRIEMDWTSGTSNNSPTIYFGSSYYSTKPSVGGTKATVGSSNSVSSNGDYSYFFFDGTTVSGSCQMSEMRIVYIANDEGVSRNFADKYLLMNTYDQGGSHGSAGGNNTCLTQYDVASTAYAKLTANQKAEFAKLSAAVTRMTDWATRNGYTFDANAGTFTQNARVIVPGDDSNTALIIVVISMASLIAVSGYLLFLKKRKEQ